MRLWFAHSEHAVKIVLLIKLYRDTRTMLVEKYTEERLLPGARAGATALIPTLHQTIAIKEIPGTRRPPVLDPGENDFTTNRLGAAFDVNSTDLLLEFERLFLVRPDASRGQRDVVIPLSELVEIADSVWNLES